MISVAAIALLTGTAAMATETAKGSFIQVPSVPNSASTAAFGINDKDVITGGWIDPSGVEHGFVGPLNGTSYKSFDDPNAPGPGTEARGINNNGYIAGFSNSSKGSAASYVPFERDSKGTITEIAKKGSLLNDLVQGLNNQGNEFAGSYVNSSFAYVGYLGSGGQFKKAIKLSGITNTGFAARAVDSAGDVVGWFYDSASVQHGFLLSGSTATQIDYPASNAAWTVLEGINDKGTITGYWSDTSNALHGFKYSMATKKFSDLKVPGSVSFVQAWGVNNKGMIAISSDAGYYVYCPAGANCSVAPHGAVKQTVKPKRQLP